MLVLLDVLDDAVLAVLAVLAVCALGAVELEAFVEVVSAWAQPENMPTERAAHKRRAIPNCFIVSSKLTNVRCGEYVRHLP